MALFQNWDAEIPAFHEPLPTADVLEGYVNLNLPGDQAPMFALEKVDYRPDGLRHLVIANNTLCMALENSHVIRLNLSNPQDLEGTPAPLPFG